MIEFVNKYNGQPMYVHETRVQEYLRLGHKLAPSNAIDVEFSEHVEEPKKKKATRKKKG